MSSFSDQNFAKKLSDLNNTQQSIQTLSLWLIHHRKHAKSIVNVWYRELLTVRASQKLTFLYLANDVIQNSKKKGPEFQREFAAILVEAFGTAAKDADSKMTKSLERLLNIWQERGIYDKELIKQARHRLTKGGKYRALRNFKQANSGSEPPAPKKKKQEPILSLLEEVEKEPGVGVPEADVLVKALSDLDSAASSDAAVREKIAALPPEVSDISNLDKLQDKEAAEKLSNSVDAACCMLIEYNGRLAAELEDRKQVAKSLRAFIAEQKNHLISDEKRLAEYRLKLSNVTSVRQELQAHIQNLPDLTLLPDVTGGLAPLPSAGDLFNVDALH
ncbi:regulation of nuclear pre-mRNA domain-containing protein 1B-like isoform X1 [Liolophura sinensis]|uniref:regulation of nuclear pre-mRNA domain-containing protein 1B-like isoform X1 n=1 Tax=Liolophura sinensis TaxID=3198878 RepID=UPI00315927D6